MRGATVDLAYRVMQEIVAGAFLVVGLLALRDFIRLRDRTRGWLAVALVCLAIVSVVGQVTSITGYYETWLTDVILVVLLASGAALVLFRAEVVPYHRITAIAFGTAVVGSAAAVVIFGIPTSLQSCGASQHLTSQQYVQVIPVIALLIVWVACLAEPAWSLWRVSSRLASVQRGRLRALSAGYGTLVVVILLSLGGSSPCHTTAWQYVIEAGSFAAIPMLYSAFAPPTWLRRIWRQKEEDALRGAIQELLLFTPDRKTLAARALPWAIRLVGGEAGLIASAGGEILAMSGAGVEFAVELLSDESVIGRPQTVAIGDDPPRRAIVRPLRLTMGHGVLIVVSGALSPVFETSEEGILSGYAASITGALDRARLYEDVTRKEKEIREARDIAESANLAKSEFLSRMSHELRTPLTAMLGFGELLELEELSEQQHEYAQTILRAGSHLLSLINDVLDIARIEEGKMSLSPEPVNVSDVMTEVMELVRPMARANSISVKTDVPDDMSVIADHQRLKQVLLNFASNGIKYNHMNGAVSVTVRAASEERVRIVVTDTGAGLSPEDVGLLFNPFERLWAQRAGIEGTGLGLALSKTLAEAMQGTVGVDSELGKGSSFWIELPVADPELLETVSTDGQQRPEGAAIPDGPRTVLYAEDTVSNIRLVDRILKRRPGVELIPAMHGKLALDLARQHNPDLILLDLHLPDLDGFEVLQQIRADSVLSSTPVVIISADATLRQRKRLIEAGANEYVTKPIRVRSFLEMIDSYLGARAHSD